MTSTSASPPATAVDRMPWPALLVLGAGTFVMVTAEMLPTAVLRPMSEGLGAAETKVAQLVSLWAAVVVLAAAGVDVAERRGHETEGGPGIAPVLVIAGLVALVLVGHYGTYTYITVLAEAPARVLPGGIAALLLAFGVASAAGLALAAR